MFDADQAEAPSGTRPARQEPSAAQKVHHYTHVVVALCEGLKELPEGDAKNAVNATAVGVCHLIDSLIASEMPRTN